MIRYKRKVHILHKLNVLLRSNTLQIFIIYITCATVVVLFIKGKAVPLQAWSSPEGSRKLRFPRFRDNSTGWW